MNDNDHLVDPTKIIEARSFLPWSTSRIDVASTCMYKFYKVYLAGEKEHSNSLTLGSLSHEIIANLLRDGEPSLDKAEIFLSQSLPSLKNNIGINEAVDEVRKMFPYMCKFVLKWKFFMATHNIAKDHIEKAYGVTESLRRSSKVSHKTYFRGIVDLWGYDKEHKILYVIDHKTNKSTMSSKKVKEHQQLLIYVAMLTLIYKLKWEKAYIALNFLRKGKLVWASVTRPEIKDFMFGFLNHLKYLEWTLTSNARINEWPAEPSFKCSWCAFKESCPEFLNDVSTDDAQV